MRLLGIDAPELHGCPRNRKCAPGDGQASKRHLTHQLNKGAIKITRVGKDRYGRSLAVVHAGTVNLSCAQLAAGRATYKRQWDDGQRIARACPSLAR
ncbi:MAG: thermonuclease family protein [Sphingobium sp.]